VTFGAPAFLFGLLALPLVAAGYVLLERRRARRARAWSREAMLPNAVRRPRRRLARAPAVLCLVGLALLLLGVARPAEVLGSVQPEPPTVALTIDVSASMAATDVRPSRIAAARKIAIAILRELPRRDRVALVSFGARPQLLVAPTLDRQAVAAMVPRVVVPRDGTAIGDALNFSVGVVVGAAGPSGVGELTRPGAVVLLSDGGQNSGGATLEDAAADALVDDVPVDTVALGTSGGAVTQPLKLDGQEISARIPVPLEEASLSVLAQQTGGRLFNAAAALRSPTQLAAIGNGLRSAEAPLRRTHSWTAASARLALLFVVAGLALSGFWFGRIV
jgi:Ca-activated chloride channel family protein